MYFISFCFLTLRFPFLGYHFIFTYTMNINKYHVLNEYYLLLREVYDCELGISGYMKNFYFFSTISIRLKEKYGATYKPGTIKKYLEAHKCKFSSPDLKRYAEVKQDIDIGVEYRCIEELFAKCGIWNKIEKEDIIDNIRNRLKINLSDTYKIEKIVNELFRQ